MSISRTAVFGDSRIINNFKNVCKAQGRIPSKVVTDFMAGYVDSHKSDGRKEVKRHGRKPGKKAAQD